MCNNISNTHVRQCIIWVRQRLWCRDILVWTYLTADLVLWTTRTDFTRQRDCNNNQINNCCIYKLSKMCLLSLLWTSLNYVFFSQHLCLWDGRGFVRTQQPPPGSASTEIEIQICRLCYYKNCVCKRKNPIPLWHDISYEQFSRQLKTFLFGINWPRRIVTVCLFAT